LIESNQEGLLPEIHHPSNVRGTELLAGDTRERYRQKLARITLDSMVQFVGLLDTDGTVLEINQVALDAVGIKLSDVAGKPFWTTFWWQVSEEINATLRESILRASQGEFVRWDAEIYGRAGGKETIIIDASLSPVTDEHGDVVFITAEGRDITEKKAHEREIARQREELVKLDELLRAAQLETLLKQAPFGAYLVDADFRIREVNPVALPVFGDIPGGLIGRDFEEISNTLWGREYANEIVSIFRHTLATGESYIAPERAVNRADRGVTEYYAWRANRIVLPDRRFGVVCYFEDIGDRNRAVQSANLLASIVESSDDAIVSKNLDGIIMSWNRGAERLFGYTASEAVGQSIAIVIPPDRLEEEPKILERLRRGERVEHFETIRKRKDGSHLNVSLTISPVRAAGGRIVGASKVARDITEIVRNRKALQEANAALQRANSDLQHFAYSASHDLQEPLRMVALYSELIKEEFGSQLGPIGEEYIGRTVLGATRMGNLLRNLRNYIQVSMMGQDPADQIDTDEILKKTLLNLELAIRDSGASITNTALPRVRMHQFPLEQVFQNLIGNAIRYRSTLPPRIHIAATRDATDWLFSVQDNGIGIEPRFNEQIFGMFKRLHNEEKYSGTGMGLAICQRAIERAGGRIWVESEPGKGSTFYFTVPIG
jgi:PAS domain S-box-containing protein